MIRFLWVAALMAALALGAAGCSDGPSWSGNWTVDEVSTPMTGTSRNPLEDAMNGGSVQLSKTEVVLPHFTNSGQEMVIPIARVESEEDTGDVILHPAAEDNYLDGTLILTPKGGDKLIVHGVPQDGPSANFFLTLKR